MTIRPVFGRRRLLSAIPVVALGATRAQAQQSKLTLATAAEGGAFVVYAQALLDVLRAVDAVLEIRGRPTKGSGENVRLLEAGEVDLALVAGEVAHEVFAGINRPVGKLTVISVMYSTPGMFVVRADSRYHSITQLKGRPVVWNTPGSGFAVQAHYVMDGLGLDMDKDFEPIYIDRLADGPPMVIEGRAAALWGGGLRWPGFVTVATSPRGARFVVPTAEEIARIRTKYGFMASLSVPAGLYPGQYDPIDTVGTWSFILARADLDDAIGRRLAMDLARAERTGLLTKHLAQSTAKNTLAAIPSPAVLQPGVAKYYRELGLL
jgi:TRAP transporter TAXI family solute receptor